MSNATEMVNSMLHNATTWVEQNFMNLVLALAIFFVGKWLAKGLTKLSRKLMEKSNLEKTLVDFLAGLIHAALFLFVVVAALAKLGIETTSIVALIGAAGLAIGLALKDSLQNFASGIMLILFKPFKAGDFVEMAGVTGIVEKIAIFSTIMRTPDNKEVIVPNGAIYGDNIVNYSARPTRRVDMVFGVSYDDDIRKVKQLIIDYLAQDERVLKDPAPVVKVSELADSSVNFIVRPWVNAADYWGVYWDAHENLKILFDENDITIPYPQMDVHVDKGAKSE